VGVLERGSFVGGRLNLNGAGRAVAASGKVILTRSRLGKSLGQAGTFQAFRLGLMVADVGRWVGERGRGSGGHGGCQGKVRELIDADEGGGGSAWGAGGGGGTRMYAGCCQGGLGNMRSAPPVKGGPKARGGVAAASPAAVAAGAVRRR